MEQPFTSYTLPISGTDFVKYIAIVAVLAQYRKLKNMEPFKPRVIYAASGGCLTAYLMMMSSFTEKVQEWALNSDMFVDRPTPFTPRLMTFALHGYLYHRSNITEYIKSVFIPSMIQDTEIVTGFYESCNPSTFGHTIKIVTNMDKARSVLSTFVPSRTNILPVFAPDPPATMITNMGLVINPASKSINHATTPQLERSIQKEYLNSVMSLAIDALHKTSNIPFLMEPLGEAQALDYGIVAPSPRMLVNGNSDHSIYFSPINIDRQGEMYSYEMIFHQVIMNDIVALRNSFNSSQCFSGTDTMKMLDTVMQFIAQLSVANKRYCLVLYTATQVDIPVHSFGEKTVWYYIQACKSGIRALLLYDKIV